MGKKVIQDSASNGSAGALYGLGLIGAVIYYISEAANVGEGIVGFLKALVWPAFVVYELMEYLGM